MAKHFTMPARISKTAARRAIATAAIATLGFGVAIPSASAASYKTPSPKYVTAQATSARGQQVVNIARQYLGVRYVYGGTTPAGFDCSGFTGYVFRQMGVNLPRTSGSQAVVGRRVPASQRQPGDLMWKPGHVAIYAGNGNMIHAPHTGTVVKEVPVYSASFVYIRLV